MKDVQATQSITIRGMSSSSVHFLNQQAKRLGMSRNQFLRKQLEQMALHPNQEVTNRIEMLVREAQKKFTFNTKVRECVYDYFPELQIVHGRRERGD
ncbi:hypothetical protein [Listeria goaensis]|uniref:hypothetical protein n=1 Tax=Listeria goaensis TaxID=1649188 RepID=UPI000B58C820|nr:hypothetical protein [Listeria goaensis]